MPSGSRLRVLVLCGGRSREHEISLLSARFVLQSLDPSRYQASVVGIDKRGRWFLEERERLLGLPADPRAVALGSALPSVSIDLAAAADQRFRVEGHAAFGADVVFPVLHGPMGEDGTVQGLFELLELPYVGSGVLGSAAAMDKDVTKRLLEAAGLPIVPHRVLRLLEWREDPQAALGRLLELGLPLFVKPCNLGSSVGVERVREPGALGAALARAFEFDQKLIVELGLDRPREIECAVLGGDRPRVSLPGEIEVLHADGFYSYAAKYLDPSGARLHVPARLAPEQSEEARALALRAFAAVECQGLARVDLFLDAGGRFSLNEINTMPGFTQISMYPKLWEASGLPAGALMTELIDDALSRARRRPASA